MSDALPAPSELLAHAAFVRRLARSLLEDEHGADDVVQETWRRSLEHPPGRAGELRGWLARVARNLAFQRRRGEARRVARERDAARTEALPSAELGLERAEVLQRVVDAVRALDEPYRATILARFYEDLPPRAIAVRDGVPLETVNTRIKRGLTQLRARLGRTRREWQDALWLLAGGSSCLPPHAGAEVVLTSMQIKTVATVAAVLLVCWGLWQLVEREPARSAPPRSSAVTSAAPAGLVEAGPHAERAPAIPEPSPAPSSSGEAVHASAPASEPAPEPAVLRGQVVAPDGAPVADARVYFGGQARARGDEPFKPFRAERIEDGVRTGPDGWFELPGGGTEVTAWHEDFSSVTVSAASAGRIELRARAALRGRLLDASGREVAGAFLRLDDRRHGPEETTDAIGRFTFERLEAGAHALWLGEEQLLACVRLEPGEEAELDVAVPHGRGPELVPSEPLPLGSLRGLVVGRERLFDLREVAGGSAPDTLQVAGALRPGRYWLATSLGIAAAFTVEPGAERVELELGRTELRVRSPQLATVQVVPADADAFLALAAARAYVWIEPGAEALFRLAPGAYRLVGQAGVLVRALELPPGGLALDLGSGPYGTR